MGHLELSGPVFQSFLLLEILLPVCTFFWLSDLESSVSQTCLFPLERFYLSFNAQPPPPGAPLLGSGVFSHFRVLSGQTSASSHPPMLFPLPLSCACSPDRVGLHGPPLQ